MAATPITINAPDASRDRSDHSRVLADQVDLLYRQAPLGIGVTLVIGIILAFELYSSAKIGELVIFWAVLMVVVCIARFLLVLAYRHARDRDTAPDSWLRRFAIGALAAGVTWGFAGAVFFPGHTDEQQVFLAFVLAGMSAGGLPLFSSVWWVYALYAAGVMLVVGLAAGVVVDRAYLLGNGPGISRLAEIGRASCRERV